jgi:hypothetical protein
MQPMSCDSLDPERAGPESMVERRVELPADPQAVWEELPGVLGDDVDLAPVPGGALHVREPGGDRVGVVHEAVPGERLSFRWMRVDGDEPPSDVEITLEPAAGGTIVHLRETRLDAAHLIRSAFFARARA